MANQPIKEPKVYSEELTKITIQNPVHADTVNPIYEKLINNDAFLKEKQEATQQEVTAHKEDYTQFKSDTENDLANYNQYASGKDVNGIFTIVEYKQADGTLYMKSTLSNADTNGNYQTDTWQFYDVDGITIIKTLTWTITYDVDGGIVSKVVA